MRRKAVSGIILILLLVGILTFNSTIAEMNETENIEPAGATGGSVTEAVDWWPMFRHDLSHTGYSTSTAPNTNHTIWNYTTDYDVTSSPAVVDGKVYVASCDGRLYCLDASTGAHIWNNGTGTMVSSPAVVDGKVFVGSSTWKSSGVYCLNASTGAHIWNSTTGDSVESSPAIVNGKVYVGSMDNKTYCLNATTGAFIWNYTTGYSVYSSPAVADGKVYVGSHDHKVYCLNASTGAFIWSYTTGLWVYSSPVVADGKVYVGSCDRKVYCFGPIPGDVNEDLCVDVYDKVLVGAAFGSNRNATDGKYWHGPPDFPGPCPYCPHYANSDLNNDGTVDIFDKVIVGVNFGQGICP